MKTAFLTTTFLRAALLRFLLLLAFASSVTQAAELLSANVYDRSNRTDLMLSFDTPFSGKVSMQHQGNIYTLMLTQTSTAQNIIKRPQTRYVKSLAMSNTHDGLKIVASITANTGLDIAKTSDGYGLRLRFQAKPSTSVSSEAPTNTLPTQETLEISSNYYYVVGALVVMLIALLFLKRLLRSNTTSINKHWFKSAKNEPVTVRFEKQLDTQNRVIMIDYAQESYLLLVGNSNVLLDKFHENEVVNQNQFDSILQEKHDELDHFLHEPAQEPLQIYKEKAANSYMSQP